MAENTGYSLGWDDEFEVESKNFVILPEGDYDFEVIEFERNRHPGSEKLPSCWKAVIHIKIQGEDGISIIKHNLFLYSTCQNLIGEFFIGIGQIEGNGKYRYNWNAIVGSKGRAKVGIREYEGKQYNEIKKFYKPESKGFQPGRF